MSRIYHDSKKSQFIRDFKFADVERGTGGDAPKGPKTFTADSYGSGAAEFIPGGFDFEYKGGLRREEIINRSIDEANQIIEQANSEAQRIREKARAEGFSEGLEKGHNEGIESAKPLMESFKSLVEEIATVRADYYGQAEKEMIDLVISVANSVIGLEIERDPSLVRNVIKKAVERLRVREKMTIKINPDDLTEAEKAMPSLSKIVEDLEKVELKTDPLITRGGCLVETNIGMIDARIESQLEELKDSFMRALEESEAKAKLGQRKNDQD